MRETYILLTALALGVTSYISTPASKLEDQEPSRTPTPNTLIVPPPTGTFVVENEQANQRIEDQFPEKITLSQKPIRLKYTYLTPGGIENQIDYNMSATVIDLDGSNDGYFLLITSGHGFSWQVLGKSIGNIPIQNLELGSIVLGDNLTLDSGKFGLDFGYESIGPGKDYAFIAVPKANLPLSDLEQLQNEALPLSSISFTSPSVEQKFYGVCNPEKDKPLIANGSHYVVDYKNLTLIKPWRIKIKCSGAGIFRQDNEKNLQFVGITSKLYPNSDMYSDVVATYLFSAMGEDKFWEAMERAVLNTDSQN